jgi:flagellar hook protein FlgE
MPGGFCLGPKLEPGVFAENCGMAACILLAQIVRLPSTQSYQASLRDSAGRLQEGVLMSLFGAMTTAISGLNAQAAAFGNISDNVANSQTVGFKGVDTAFIDYLTVSNATQNVSGAVTTIPQYQNNVQGTLAQSSDPLALAITGQGFFPVSTATSKIGGQTVFSTTPAYTRTGDFQLNAQGYLVNSAGNYLNGWPVNGTTGVVNQNALAPIQVTQTVYNPVPTSTITLSANLPATPSAGTPVSSQVTVYDALGTPHTVTLDWTQNATNDWTVAINAPDDISAPAEGSADVQFGTTSGNGVAAGTIGALGTPTGTVTTTSYSANGAADLKFTANFGQGSQAITVNLGNFGASTGLTQYAGTAYTLNGISQNGVPPGSYSSISTAASGDISVNYSNGQSRVIAQVPVVTFAAPDALQRQNGQAFTATIESGNPTANTANTNGAGSLVVGSVEQSNVDIAQQFSKLIVAQEAYSANTKLITTSDQLMQSTINMKQ